MTVTAEQTTPVLLDLDLPHRYKKAEIIEGNVIMSPLRAMHNETIHRLMTQLDGQLPADWHYASDVITPFEIDVHEYCPDLAVIPRAEYARNISVCKPEWIKVVFEVVSPTTRVHDYGVKVGVYASAGIAEYVVFDPYARSATRYAHPENGEYTLREVIHYGRPIKFETLYPLEIETADLPVDPKD